MYLTQGQELFIDASRSMFISDYPITEYSLNLDDGRVIRSQDVDGLAVKGPLNLSDLKFGPITYPNWGFYNLRLTLTNQRGDKSSNEILIFVEPPK